MQIYEIARTYLNTPFKHQGRLKNIGIDCIGLIVCVAKDMQLAIANNDITGYSRRADGISLENSLNAFLKKDDEISITANKIALVQYLNIPHHVGIISNKGIIHAYAPARKVVETKLNTDLLSRITATYDLVGA